MSLLGQEARVCCSVEIMEVHVEHLKRRHAVESAELLETRKRLLRSRGRNHSDSGKFCPSVARRNYDTSNRKLIWGVGGYFVVDL